MNKILVWNMHTSEWVELKKYMRYCCYIWTKHLKYSEKDWNNL